MNNLSDDDMAYIMNQICEPTFSFWCALVSNDFDTIFPAITLVLKVSVNSKHLAKPPLGNLFHYEFAMVEMM